MDVFEMVVLVVLFSLIAGLLRTWIKSRPAGSGGPAGMTPDQESRMSRLEERIKALESVVSDGSYELKQKFKDLEKSS
ncbi:MAG: hypothetical protein ACT4PK_11540 [Gammaproteobacteria bacterium]